MSNCTAASLAVRPSRAAARVTRAFFFGGIRLDARALIGSQLRLFLLQGRFAIKEMYIEQHFIPSTRAFSGRLDKNCITHFHRVPAGRQSFGSSDTDKRITIDEKAKHPFVIFRASNYTKTSRGCFGKLIKVNSGPQSFNATSIELVPKPFFSQGVGVVSIHNQPQGFSRAVLRII